LSAGIIPLIYKFAPEVSIAKWLNGGNQEWGEAGHDTIRNPSLKKLRGLFINTVPFHITPTDNPSPS
jgi:hypothetical protein